MQPFDSQKTSDLFTLLHWDNRRGYYYLYLFRQHAFWVLNFTCICRRPVIFCSCYSIQGNFRFLLLLEQVSEDIAVSYFSPNTKKIGAQKISDIFFHTIKRYAIWWRKLLIRILRNTWLKNLLQKNQWRPFKNILDRINFFQDMDVKGCESLTVFVPVHILAHLTIPISQKFQWLKILAT